MRRALSALILGLSVLASTAMAPRMAVAAPLSDIYNEQTELEFRVGLQMRLAWTGDYSGAVDGTFAPSSLRAIRDYQARHGMEATGVIDEAMLRRLILDSDAAESGAGFQLIDDKSTGVRIGLPLALVSKVGDTASGTLWRSPGGDIEIETVRFSDGTRTLASLQAVLATSTAARSVDTAVIDQGFLTISGREGGHFYMMRFAADGRDIRGYALTYSDDMAALMAPVGTVTANLFDPFGERPGDDGASMGLVAEAGSTPMERVFGNANAAMDGFPSDRSRSRSGALLELGVHSDVPHVAKEGGAAPGSRDDSSDSSGSGFVVSRDGWVLTNAHVAGSCTSVLVGDKGPAETIIVDEANDLALVHVKGLAVEPLMISTGMPRLGEDVLALGFPLRSILADSLNVTRGNISSLLGLMNDARYLQISAPIQPGNSGGPLVDLSGRVVGVVTAKLNAVAVADVTGDIPQSINFAIRPDAAVKFLRENGIAFTIADPARPMASVADTTAGIQDSILPILCLGDG